MLVQKDWYKNLSIAKNLLNVRPRIFRQIKIFRKKTCIKGNLKPVESPSANVLSVFAAVLNLNYDDKDIATLT